MALMPQTQPQLPTSPEAGGKADHTPAWLEWLKRPENLMTGIVLAAGLTQGRSRDGQSDAGVIGERLLGALAFRGGLDQGMQAQRNQQQEMNLRQEAIRDRSRQGESALSLQARGMEQQARQADADRVSRERLATTPRPLTPEEAQLAQAQAGYYNRMPRDPSGTGQEDGMFEDMYEQKLFEQWSNQQIMGGQPLDLMKWAQVVQPYRNARLQMKVLADNGLMGELVQDPTSGTWKVRVAGVADPQGQAETPMDVPVNIEPPAPTAPPADAPSVQIGGPELGPVGKHLQQNFGSAAWAQYSDEELKTMLRKADRGKAAQIRIELRERSKRK